MQRSIFFFLLTGLILWLSNVSAWAGVGIGRAGEIDRMAISTVPSGGPMGTASSAGLALLSPEERKQMRDQIRRQWEQMSPEERQRRREEWRERWQRMPPDERFRQREEMRQRWERLTPEQRQRMRDAIREHGFRGDGPRPGPEQGRR